MCFLLYAYTAAYLKRSHSLQKISIIFVLLPLLVSCSKAFLFEELVKTQAIKSDTIWLCTVDISGQKVRYRAKLPLKTSANARHFKPGQILPESGPVIESGTQYGDEAIVFMTLGNGDYKLSSNLTLILYDGKLDNGMTREEMIKLIHKSMGAKGDVTI